MKKTKKLAKKNEGPYSLEEQKKIFDEFKKNYGEELDIDPETARFLNEHFLEI